MSSLNQAKTQSGFTIIEVVVTLFIFIITLVLFQVTANSVLLNKYGRYKEVAIRIADQKMQTIRTTDFDSIPATGSFNDPLMTSLPNGAGTITVTNTTATLKDVTVRVSWRNSKNTGDQDVELRTYISNVGLGQ